ncbi:UvrB/UvrC motif-containing protein [Desulforamulus hydrothermalis]|uniref:UvrB/UvrC protein n=1 Tax=Desulforamulus hydrothermalis Lam5 = DSM 18033 TaxID=1121428 RepID=K8DYE3_9FIRM|nr:UvrB/UvrC motif-containing protein [Desulforamulus hydrothermalis]CCO07760.1 UvrB/UvrC protein [Desulforamulus hydrothermalis Lam5 = DSM 18033]SHH39937.1 Protein-arginine kinase activator protein McsA [Desulforamulus hydrothermalis Lam5 = DSM 18033]
MLCDRCQKRPAQVHFTQVINNTKKQMNLCAVCAAEMQAESFGFVPQLNLHDFLAGLINHHFAGANLTGNAMTRVRCERCGATESQVAQSGLFGCSECYTQFGDRVQPLLKRIHGSITHTGKVPRRTGGKALLIKEIRMLKSQLQDAVKQEEFEKAARLRDRIKELEQQMQ